METPYKVKTSVFEGPLELLYELIEKRKLGINQISLAQVTDDFISYIKGLGTMPLAYTANFIITAAALILIKSKSLLPSLSLSEEEEGNIDDLTRRLNLYRLFRSVGEKIGELFGKAPLWKRPYPKVVPLFVPDPALTLTAIREGIESALQAAPREAKTETITLEKVMSLEEMIDRLTERVKETIGLSFKEWSGHGKARKKEDKIHVIVSFLAMLELMKQGIILAKQDGEFDDIVIERPLASA